MKHVFSIIVVGCLAASLFTNARMITSDGLIQSKEKRGEAHEETALSLTDPSHRIGAIHWNWARRVRALVDYIISIWYTRLNTYYDHPTDWGLDHVSIDCWDVKGRGYSLAESIGDQTSEYLVANANYWGVRWVIWWGWIWTPASGWQRYTDPLNMHYDHVHVTIR
jgi:hypothetical protein